MTQSLQQHSHRQPTRSVDLDASRTQFMVEETRKLFQHDGSDAELLQRIMVVIDCMSHLTPKSTPDNPSS